MNTRHLEKLVGKSVRIDRGGPEARKGKLIAIKDDHIVLHVSDDNEEGTIYYKIDHVKSVTIDTLDLSDVRPARNAPEVEQAHPQYIDESNLISVMQKMKNRWVLINRGGPERLRGVLIDAKEDLITIIYKKELIHIDPFHIRNVSYVMEKQEDAQASSANNEENRGNNKEKDQKKK